MKFSPLDIYMSNLIPSSKQQISAKTVVLQAAVLQERLRQARYSFNLALTVTGFSACVGLVGAGLLLFGKLPEESVIAAAGVTTSACCVCIQRAKEMNDRLDKILAELNES